MRPRRTRAALAALLAAACYTVPGSDLAARYDSIYVPALQNETVEPGLHTRVTNAVRRELQNNGQLRLVNAEADADLILDGTLTAYRVRVTSFDDDDNPLQFIVALDGDLRVRERRSGDVIWRKRITADDFYQVRRARRTGARARGRADGLDEAAEEFAEIVVYDLIDSAW